MIKKSALGKGIGALLDDTLNTAYGKLSSDSGVTQLKPEDLIPNPDQPRKDFNLTNLKELAESVSNRGIIQPIIVSEIPDMETGKHLILAGERRWRAAKIAGLAKVPVVFRKVKEHDMLEIALLENIQREDLNVIELAKAYSKLIRDFSYTQEQLAKRLSKSRSQITNTLRILQLPDSIRDSLSENKISFGHAKILAGIDNPDKQISMHESILTNEWSVRDLEKNINSGDPRKLEEESVSALNSSLPSINLSQKEIANNFDKDYLNTLERSLSDKLKTDIKIRTKGDSGKMEIIFKSKEELDRITDNIFSFV